MHAQIFVYIHCSCRAYSPWLFSKALYCISLVPRLSSPNK